MKGSFFGPALVAFAAAAFAAGASAADPAGAPPPPAGAHTAPDAHAGHAMQAGQEGHDDHAAETAHRGPSAHGHEGFDPIYDYKPQPKIDYPAALTGKTRSAAAFLPIAEPQPVVRGAGASSLRRVMFEAYLAPGGDATVRSRNLATASYTQPARTRWSLRER